MVDQPYQNKRLRASLDSVFQTEKLLKFPRATCESSLSSIVMTVTYQKLP